MLAETQCILDPAVFQINDPISIQRHPDDLCPLRSSQLKRGIDDIVDDGEISQKAGFLENKPHPLQTQLLHGFTGQLRHIAPSPDEVSSMPLTQYGSVDFPQPQCPVMTTNSPPVNLQTSICKNPVVSVSFAQVFVSNMLMFLYFMFISTLIDIGEQVDSPDHCANAQIDRKNQNQPRRDLHAATVVVEKEKLVMPDLSRHKNPLTTFSPIMSG